MYDEYVRYNSFQWKRTFIDLFAANQPYQMYENIKCNYLQQSITNIFFLNSSNLVRLGNLMYINNNNTTVNDKYKWTQSLSPAAIFRTNHVSLQPSWKYGTSTCTFWLQTNCLFVKDLLLFFFYIIFLLKIRPLFCHLFHFQFLNVLLQSASVPVPNTDRLKVMVTRRVTWGQYR